MFACQRSPYVGEAMRAPILGLVALVLAACGSTSEVPAPVDGGTGNTGTTQVNLRISTSGNGVVRGAGADCRVSCTAQYAKGSQIHLVAVADASSSFTGWGGACNGTGGCDLTLDADRDVSATFAAVPPPPPPPPPDKHRLTVIVQGKGRVTSSPSGIDCDSAQCSADFNGGTSVSLTAAAAAGYDFSGWGTDCSGGGGCSLTLSRDSTVYANFVAQPPPPPPPPPRQVHLTASTTGPGTITGGGLNCGESTFTCDVTVAAGTTVTLTASSGGGTRFFGWGGACSGTATTCQLTLQSDTKVSAEFQSEVMALAPNDGTNSTVMALNSTNLFWPRYSTPTAIWSVPKKGGTALRVTGGYAYAMVADDSYLYWTDTNNLYSTPVGGGGEVALLATSTSMGRMALDESGALYWIVNNGNNGAGTVHRMQDRADSVIASGQSPTSIAVDATHAYFGDFTSNTGTIKRVPRKGGAVQSVFSCGTGCFVASIRVDADNVYFRLGSSDPSLSGEVGVVSKSDSRARIVSSGPSGSYFLDFDVNASVLYWNRTGGSGPYGIFRANADGSGYQAIDSSSETDWFGVRVDDTAVYYWHGGAIIRRLK